MKYNLAILFIFILSKGVSQFYVSETIDVDEYTIIHHKISGEKVSYEAYKKYKSANPGMVLEPVVDKWGFIDSYLIDPSKGEGVINLHNPAERVNQGELFPDFVMKNYNGKTINSDSLIGKIVLMQFNLSVRKPLLDPTDFSRFKRLTEKYPDLIAILVTKSSKLDMDIYFQLDPGNVEIVPDADNFDIRYKIIKFPTYVVLDREGKLVRYIDRPNLDVVEQTLRRLY